MKGAGNIKVKCVCTPCGTLALDIQTCEDCGGYFCDPCADSHSPMGAQCREYIAAFTQKAGKG